jgi:hypothetical protein
LNDNLRILFRLRLWSLQHRQYNYMSADGARIVFLQLLLVHMQMDSSMLDAGLAMLVALT